MDTLQNMRVFVRVVEAGSFTAAAQHLNTTTAYASRAVSDLEAHLRARLLNRTTRRIALTEAGERYLQRCEQILAYVDQAEAEAGDAHARPSGKLKVHSMTSFGQHYIVPMISRYQQRHPSVQVDLTLAQRVPDLLDEGYDVSVVLASDLPDSGLVSARLGSVYSIACASPAYIEQYGAPHVLSDLVRHTCLHLMTPVFPPDRWVFDGPNGQETVSLGPSTFTVNVAEAMVVAIRESMGIGVLPTSSALPGLRAGTLVRVLPQYTMQELNVYALYPSRQYLDAKIRTWVEFLREALPDTLAADAESLKEFVVT
ncbi:LysR family transcriptional regulator [Caballeronia novacaledonica]|jgi:DNA-binding transcriptional LysR family regulator|uniref:LysR family transcriptional regulator n=1 Tax=Caballeronia novacaledonica TaxID=1544861 RepID=A0ACB5QJD7_9BURK|nr:MULTISPECIES: LysR family transcriptional regulator [Caballeronia]MBC8637484.1 LysR family transcriptional regulator [Caballeronia sp. EK]GJH08656.1 LysR family transcriptional regulator [Caballeronia novacaledonica]GJH15183.1 LysR family transcriptional regulator [Caballeronia novacaledonica]